MLNKIKYKIFFIKPEFFFSKRNIFFSFKQYTNEKKGKK